MRQLFYYLQWYAGSERVNIHSLELLFDYVFKLFIFSVFCYIPPNVPGAKNVSLLLRAHYSNQHFPPIGASVGDTQRSDKIFAKVWRLDLTVPFFLIVFLGPLINFKSPTFFTKFNALGECYLKLICIFNVFHSISHNFDCFKVDSDAALPSSWPNW